MKRQSIGTKSRFEIFKRDKFTCQYCGRTPEQGVVLNVDHIIPVAKGGGNETVNLITSCFDCNIGKGANLTEAVDSKSSVSNVSEQLKLEIAKRKEIEKQLKEYYKYKTVVRTYDPTRKFLNETLDSELGFTLTDVGMNSFEKLYKKLTVDDFIDAIQIVKRKFDNTEEDSQRKFKYLCGVMYNKHKAQTDPLYESEREVKFYYLNHPNRRGSDYYVGWRIRPYIELHGQGKVKDCIDKVFNDGYSNGGYFASVIDLLEDLEVDA